LKLGQNTTAAKLYFCPGCATSTGTFSHCPRGVSAYENNSAIHKEMSKKSCTRKMS